MIVQMLQSFDLLIQSSRSPVGLGVKLLLVIMPSSFSLSSCWTIEIGQTCLSGTGECCHCGFLQHKNKFAAQGIGHGMLVGN